MANRRVFPTDTEQETDRGPEGRPSWEMSKETVSRATKKKVYQVELHAKSMNKRPLLTGLLRAIFHLRTPRGRIYRVPVAVVYMFQELLDPLRVSFASIHTGIGYTIVISSATSVSRNSGGGIFAKTQRRITPRSDAKFRAQCPGTGLPERETWNGGPAARGHVFQRKLEPGKQVDFDRR